jgi:hypothetical protein
VIVILSKPSIESVSLALNTNVRDILLWPSPPNKKGGPLIKNIPYSIGLESGTRSGSIQTLRRVETILSDLVEILEKKSSLELSRRQMGEKNFYLVYGKIEERDVKNEKLRDFKRVVTGKEEFTALLFGLHQKILGYKMKKVDTDWVMEYISR